MERKNSDVSNLMDKIMSRLGGSGEGGLNRSEPSQKKVRFSVWYFIAAMLAFVWFQSYMGGRQSEKVAYSDFKQWARDGKVENLVVGPEQITGNVKDEKGQARSFVTVRMEDPQLVEQLEQKGIKFTRDR
jgi:cell division protease FtsH